MRQARSIFWASWLGWVKLVRIIRSLTAYATNGIAVGDGSVTDAQTAVHIITGNGVPTLTTQPAGTLYLRKDGTSTGLYQYLNGAWVAYS